MRARALTTTICSALALTLIASPAGAATKRQTALAAALGAGGAAYGIDPDQTPEMPTGRIIDGLAYPPKDAPAAVKKAIWAANELVGKPYKYGGGHARVFDSGYDCSGTVSFALIHGKLLDSPLDSGSFMRWGERGEGDWITVYTNPSHAYVVIAGMRLDTSAAGDPSGLKGPRWRPTLRDSSGFKARHPENF